MKNKIYRWNDLNACQVDLIIQTYAIFFKRKGIVTSKEKILRLLKFVSPNVIFEYKNDNIKAFEFDAESLDFMRELSFSKLLL
ncbi:MAG: hypothetical protein V3U92_02020 [Cellulophaga sp.]